MLWGIGQQTVFGYRDCGFEEDREWVVVSADERVARSQISRDGHLSGCRQLLYYSKVILRVGLTIQDIGMSAESAGRSH